MDFIAQFAAKAGIYNPLRNLLHYEAKLADRSFPTPVIAGLPGNPALPTADHRKGNIAGPSNRKESRNAFGGFLPCFVP